MFRICCTPQINSLQLTFAAQVGNDPQIVGEIVCDEQRVGIGTQSNSGWVNWRMIAVVTWRIRSLSKTADIDERSINGCRRSRRDWCNRRHMLRCELKDPNLVFKTAGHVQRI